MRPRVCRSTLDPELLEALGRMATRSDVGVHIISAVDHAVLGRWFEFVPVTLWAEHGLWHRRRDERRWRRTQTLDAGLDRRPARVPRAIHRPDSGFVRRGALDRVRVALRPDESRDRRLHEHGSCSRCFRKPEMPWASR